MAEHSGHRQRLFQKLKEGKLTQHEYLEMLLFNAMPRRNTNDLAHRLYSEFGGLKKVLNASYEQLMKVEGVGESVALYIVCLGKILEQCKTEEQEETPCSIAVYEFSSFVAFVKQEYAHLQHERLDVYLLDSDSRIIGRKTSSLAHTGEVFVEPTFFTQLFAAYSPSGIVLVHNHPQSAAKPSDADKEMTEKCQILCSLHNVMFCDHVIYAKGHRFSYYDSGNLQKISKHYSIDNIVGGGNTHGGK